MVERTAPGMAEWQELAAPHLARYLLAGEWARNKCVLDAGSGSGYGTALLAYAGADSVMGLDIDSAAIEQARHTYREPKVTFRVADCETLPADIGPFDLICCFENIEHLKQPARFLERAARCLHSDGILLISTPDRSVTPPFIKGRPRNPFHHHEWYREEFQTLLACCFEDVEMRVQVVTTAQQARVEALTALRQGLAWNNPLAYFLWRKWPFVSPKRARPYKKLAGLSAASPADYPIVPLALASLWGTPCFHFAICRRPR